MVRFQYTTDKVDPGRSGLKDTSDNPTIPQHESSAADELCQFGLGQDYSESYLGFEPLFADLTPSTFATQDQAADALPSTNHNGTNDAFNSFYPSKGEFPSSESSQSESSSTSSKRRKTNRVSMSSTIAGEGSTRLSGVQSHRSSGVDVNQMNNLAMQSKNASPSDSIGSWPLMENQSSGHRGAGNSHVRAQSTRSSSESSNSSKLEMAHNQEVTHGHPPNAGLSSPNPIAVNGGNRPPNMMNRLPGEFPSGSMTTHHTLGDPRYRTLSRLSSFQQPQSNVSLRFEVLSDRKSTRVETALDIRLVLRPPWDNIHKLRIHRDHVTKVKHQQELQTPMTSDTLELRGIVLTAAALKDLEIYASAIAHAGVPGQTVEESVDCSTPIARESLSEEQIAEEINKQSQQGNPVKLCSLCNHREAKRLQRSTTAGKQKPGESKEWLDESSLRTLVFNDRPITEFRRASSNNPSARAKSSAAQLLDAPSAPRLDPEPDDRKGNTKKKKGGARRLPPPPVEEGTMAVDLSMRICCYCRHHQEPEGFRVVFVLVNSQRQVVARTITEPIMITDDHKAPDRKGNNSPPASAAVVNSQYFPDEGAFLQDPSYRVPPGQLPQSFSTPDLPTAGQCFGLQDQMNFETPKFQPQQQIYSPSNHTSFQPSANYHAANFTRGASMFTTTPNRSRPASPSGLSGPQQKRRRASGSGRIPHGLTMTSMSGEQDFRSQPPTSNCHGLPNNPGIALRRNHLPRAGRLGTSQGAYRTNPSTSPDIPAGAMTNADRSQSIEYTNQSRVFSSSEYGSRAQSPAFSLGQPSPDLSIALENQLRNIQDSREVPRTPSRPTSRHTNTPGQRPPMTYEITVNNMCPNDGSVHGGNDVAFLGNGFYEGLRVLFGGRPTDEVTIHSSTTMICKVPPGEGPGRVHVTFDSLNTQRLPALTGLHHWYNYVDEERRDGVPLAISDPQISEEDYDPYIFGQGMQQFAPQQSQFPQQFHGNAKMDGFQHRPSSRHDIAVRGLPADYYKKNPQVAATDVSGTHKSLAEVAPPPSEETPPPYSEECPARDQKILLNAASASLAVLAAKGIVDHRIKAESPSSTPSSSSQAVVASKFETIPSQRDELDLLERKREVKGLSSDLKLWSFWVYISFRILSSPQTASRLITVINTQIPVLIFVLIAMVQYHAPWVWPLIGSCFGAVSEYLFPRVRDNVGRVVGLG